MKRLIFRVFPPKRCVSHSGVFHIVAGFFLLCGNQGSAESRFGGGMTGYFHVASIRKADDRIRGLAWGLGGILNYNVSRNFRVGGMGSTYRLGYENPGMKGSFIDMGFGGLCLEYCIPIKADKVALGLMVGGGRVTNLHIWSKRPADSISARYESYGILIGAPIVSYEHALTKVISALIRLDYPAGFHDGRFFLLGSPGLRVGILFNK
jgi:hypothetical protein